MDPEKNPEENKPPEVSSSVRSEIKPLRTYQGDIEEAISKNKTSGTTIFVAEQKRRGFAPGSEEEQAHIKIRNKFFVTFGMGLFIMGIIIVSAVYYVRSRNEVVVSQKIKSVIGFSKETKLVVASSTKEQVRKRVMSEKDLFKMPTNSVLYINILGENNLPSDIPEFTNIIAPQIPSTLQRSFEKEYMLGVYSADTKEPFIIFTTEDYPSSYSGMLKWEKTLASDLSWLFGIKESTTTIPFFIDEELQNKDLRILKDENGKTVLVYSFINKNTLVITSNQNILTALSGKYVINQQTR